MTSAGVSQQVRAFAGFHTHTSLSASGRFCWKSRFAQMAWILTGENAIFKRCYVKSEPGSLCQK